MEKNLKDQLLQLIRSSSTDLSEDVENALKEARDAEDEGGTARSVFDGILENVRMARENTTPICQDTGALLFFFDVPVGTDERPYREAAKAAAQEATKTFLLRPNAVDPVTGKNSGDNVGHFAPYFHFEQWDKDHVRVRLMQKGGGSENVSAQYKLPDSKLGAGRDLKGVQKVVLDAINTAQGQGCAPGIVSVGIGGDRTTSYMLAKEQFFRKLGDRSTDPALKELEIELLNKCNSLGIGPMGFGGKTTVMDVFCATAHRHPATYYVSVSYLCWACRRKSMTISKNGEASYD